MDKKPEKTRTGSFFAKWKGRNLIKEIRSEQQAEHMKKHGKKLPVKHLAPNEEPTI